MATAENDAQGGGMLAFARLIAGMEAKGVMMLLGVLSAIVGGYVLAGLAGPGALPYTAQLRPTPLTFAIAFFLLTLGLTLIARTASERYVEKVDKEAGMGVVAWTSAAEVPPA